MGSMERLKELKAFVKARKVYWMVPLLFVFLLLSLIIVSSSNSIITPLIYALF